MKWKRVCAASDIAPNTLKKFEVDGITLIVAHAGGSFRAFPPFCPHMEEPLEQSGVCDANGKLTCIKHLWSWELASGSPQGEAEKALLLYSVKREGDDVLVDLEKELKYEYDEDNVGSDNDDDFFKS